MNNEANESYRQRAIKDRIKAKSKKELKKRHTVKIVGLRMTVQTNKSRVDALKHYQNLYPNYEIEFIK
jgi:hypothetical protein